MPFQCSKFCNRELICIDLLVSAMAVIRQTGSSAWNRRGFPSYLLEWVVCSIFELVLQFLILSWPANTMPQPGTNLRSRSSLSFILRLKEIQLILNSSKSHIGFKEPCCTSTVVGIVVDIAVVAGTVNHRIYSPSIG